MACIHKAYIMRFKINFHSFPRYNVHPNKISNIGGCLIASRQMFVHRSSKVVPTIRYSFDLKINGVFLIEREVRFRYRSLMPIYLNVKIKHIIIVL